jgi:hypothetical protein
MDEKLVAATLILFGLVVGLFIFAPVVYYPTPPPLQLASLGSLPAYKSLSCEFFGIGASIWRVYYNNANGANYSEWTWMWTYHLNCEPLG